MIKLEPGDNCLMYAHVGSRVTCNPPVLDTDNDVLILVAPDQFQALESAIYKAGGDRCGECYGDDAPLLPMRLGEMNYLLTDDRDYFDEFLRVTAVVKHLNVLCKGDRKAVFKAILDGDPTYLANGYVKVVKAPAPVPEELF